MIISQYTRGDTPCTTCSRLWFISNLTYFSLQTLWRAILSISYRIIQIYSRWYALYNLQPATIHLKPYLLFSPDAMEGNIKFVISQYTRGDTLYNLQPVTIHLEPHSLLSPDAMEGNIKYIISQHTRGDTPCTTCSRLRFVSNLTHSFLAPWWCQPWYRQAPYMVVRKNEFALCCSAYHNRPILCSTTCLF